MRNALLRRPFFTTAGRQSAYLPRREARAIGKGPRSIVDSGFGPYISLPIGSEGRDVHTMTTQTSAAPRRAIAPPQPSSQPSLLVVDDDREYCESFLSL